MQDLIDSLVSQLGVSQSQAQGGASAIFKAAQERLGSEQFDRLLGSIPGVNDLLSKAPAPGGGGLLGGLASLTSTMASTMASTLGGNNDLAQGAKLLGAFGSLGMNKDTLMRFIPVVLQFLESKGGKELVTNVRAALKL